LQIYIIIEETHRKPWNLNAQGTNFFQAGNLL